MNDKEFSIKKWMDSGEYSDKKNIINREINAHKIELDKDVFKKSPEEKAQLFMMKQEWKKRMLREGRKI